MSQHGAGGIWQSQGLGLGAGFQIIFKVFRCILLHGQLISLCDKERHSKEPRPDLNSVVWKELINTETRSRRQLMSQHISRPRLLAVGWKQAAMPPAHAQTRSGVPEHTASCQWSGSPFVFSKHTYLHYPLTHPAQATFFFSFNFFALQFHTLTNSSLL